MKTQILKLGSDIWWNEKGHINYESLRRKAKEIKEYEENEGISTVLVFSGAIKIEKIRQNDTRKTGKIPILDLSRYAGVGQIDLIISARDVFKEIYGVSQYLVTYNEITHKLSREHLNNNIISDLEHKIIPCINYNDKVDYNESRSDNDQLAAKMALLVGAERLIILGNYEGFCENPDNKKTLIKEVHRITKKHYSMCLGTSTNGTGGFKTKLDAAKIATKKGIPVLIANVKYNLYDIIKGDVPRTYFVPKHL